MGPPLLICDLDGTLVDSQPGVADALRTACHTAGIEPREPLDGLPIGPPLDELLRSVTGLGAGEALDHLRRLYIEAYDGGACRLTVPFVGVEEMLQSLCAEAVELALATNKRRKPTDLILEALGWRDRFAVVETVDSRRPAPRTKAQMLRDTLTVLSPSAAAYLGDTVADINAAREVGLPCILASWGYGAGACKSTTTVVRFPDEVVRVFATAVQSQTTDF